MGLTLKKTGLVLSLAFLALGASRCAKIAVRADQFTALAIESNDVTAIVQGCGSQPVTGYTYCRVREGGQTNGTLRIYAPPSKCLDEQSCASIQLFFPDGTPSVGYVIPKGNGSVDIPWSEITKTAVFYKNQRGFWPFIVTWKWIGTDEKEHVSKAEGEIRLRVYAEKYAPLHMVSQDPNFVWKWTDGPYQMHVTTTGRASVSKD